LSKRYSPISTLFSLVSSRAFTEEPHSRFWCRDLKLCLLDFLMMLDLALSQIYTRVFHLWKSVPLDNAWVKDFCPFISFFSLACFPAFSNAGNSRFWCGDPKLCLQRSLKMLVLALYQIYTNAFHLLKSIDLISAYVGDSRPYQHFFSRKLLGVWICTTLAF